MHKETHVVYMAYYLDCWALEQKVWGSVLGCIIKKWIFGEDIFTHNFPSSSRSRYG